jgi:hypothetical protein
VGSTAQRPPLVSTECKSCAPSWKERVAYRPQPRRRSGYWRRSRQVDRWQVPADLIAQLESRERTHPRHLLRIEKARAPERDVAVDPISDSERERLALGQTAAARLGFAFVAAPARFQGRLAPSPSGPSGTEYIQVVDYRHRQLTLVPKPKEAEPLRGKIVTLSRDPGGRLLIRTSPEISR